MARKSLNSSSWGSLRRLSVLEAILDSASQCIMAADRHGRIRAVNSRAEMFGYSADELLGKSVDELVPDSVRAEHVKHRASYAGSPRVRPMGAGLDLVARRKDGSTFPVEISLSYVGSGEGLLVIAFISDIAQRKTLEEQLFQSQKLEEIGRLAGGVAHDFNNLLTVIIGNDRFLLNQLSTLEPSRAYAEEIMKASERATALTRQLLAFSRRQVIQPVVLSINDALKQSEKLMRRLVGEGIEVAYRFGADAGKIRIDPSQLDQVVLNLLINARDAMPYGGSAMVETASVFLGEDYARMHFGVQPGPHVQLTVSDTGTGIDPETQKHIFEPFFSTKSQSHESGTGLGLATVYGIVKQNGGDIWVYSEVGVGTTFKVYFPKIQNEAEAAMPDQTGKKDNNGTETVLVVEDEAGVRDVVCSVLRMAGYRVLEAPGSREAIQISHAFEGNIHLLVTDVVMPYMGGQSLAAELRGSRPDLKVLYLSGYTENSIVKHGVLEPAVNFLQKPFDFDMLLAKVRQSLES